MGSKRKWPIGGRRLSWRKFAGLVQLRSLRSFQHQHHYEDSFNSNTTDRQLIVYVRSWGFISSYLSSCNSSQVRVRRLALENFGITHGTWFFFNKISNLFSPGLFSLSTDFILNNQDYIVHPKLAGYHYSREMILGTWPLSRKTGSLIDDFQACLISTAACGNHGKYKF